MKKEWIEVKEIGMLYMEQVLISFNLPILFVCSDNMDRKYLCMNVDDDSMHVIAEIDVSILIDMLESRITMKEVFKNSLCGNLYLVWYNYDEKVLMSKVCEASTFDQDLLPEEGAYFELDNKAIKDYLEELKSQSISYNEGLFSEPYKISFGFCKLIPINGEFVESTNYSLEFENKNESEYSVLADSLLIA